MRLKFQIYARISVSEKELRFAIHDLFLAGSETTTTTLRWSLLFMAAYPDIQQKVYEELSATIGKDRQPSMNDKRNTPYTEAVLNEVSRSKIILSSKRTISTHT